MSFMRTIRQWPLTSLAVVLAACLVLGGAVGAYSISPSHLFPALFGFEGSESDQAVLMSIRLPRVLLGAIIGAGLGTAGAALQGLFRNPLADPGLIGVSSGAAVGAVGMLYFLPAASASLGVIGLNGLTAVGAILGGIVSVLLVYRWSTSHGRTSTVNMLLFGIAINALCAAAIGAAIYAADEARLRSITLWMLGSLASASWSSVAWATGLILPTSFGLFALGRGLNAIALGEAQAHHLGVDVTQLKRRVVAMAAIAVAAGVAFSGLIAFIGLVVPHLARLALGPDHRIGLPASALIGASLMVVADVAARITVAPAELPIGLLTSLLGAPFLLFLLARHARLQAK